MARLHTQLQTILNNYSETGIQDISEEAGCLMLELSSAIADDLEKSQPFGTVDNFTKMSDINDVREAAQSLKEKNNELTKQMEINDFFTIHATKFHARDYDKLREISKRYVESGHKPSTDDLIWLGQHNINTPELRRESETAEAEKKNRLIKLGGLKVKKEK